MRNPIDLIARALSPGWALSRAKSRQVLRAYEAAKSNQFHKPRTDNASGDQAAGEATQDLRLMARDLEQNHDIARGILSALVNNVVGTGLRAEPMIRDNQGELMVALNAQLLELWNDWQRKPEVTGELHFSAVQRLAARSMFRDGEIFGQHLVGQVRGLAHGTIVPYSIELIEGDLVPTDLNDEKRRISYGIQRNSWGRATKYFVYKKHPGEALLFSSAKDTKPIPAARMLHLKLMDRVPQGRGVTVFASVLHRLDDLKDFEESERIAARIAAAQVMAITKAPDAPGTDYFDEAGNPIKKHRDFQVSPGTVWDDLLPGEEPQIISSDRPNNNLESYRNSQLRAAAAGTEASYPTISRDFGGSYSSQRQGLVESWQGYLPLREYFRDHFCQPVYERFVQMAITSGELEIDESVNKRSLFAAEWRGDPMPWVDPLREWKAEQVAVEMQAKSVSQVVRDRGGNPVQTLEQIAAWKEKAEALGIAIEESKSEEPAPIEGEDDEGNRYRLTSDGWKRTEN